MGKVQSKVKIAIIGGGLAGLAAAVFLADSDKSNKLDISLYEGSPKLGGRAYSFKDPITGSYFDNGQHILAGWYKNTFDYLRIIGTYSGLNFQRSLEVNFIDTDGTVLKLKSLRIPAPFNMFAGLIRFRKFTTRDKLSLLMLPVAFFKSGKGINALELLSRLNQTDNLVKYFWEPFIYAVFNAKAENVSGEIFLKILRTGFLKPGNSNLVIPDVNLTELFIDDTKYYFKEKGVKCFKGKKIRSLTKSSNRIHSALLETGEEIKADHYISAVSFFRFPELIDEPEFEAVSRLKPSSITSVHIFLGEDIPEAMLADNSFGMTGLIGRTVQWIFKRNSRHLSLVISGSDFIDDGEGDSITDTEANRIYGIAYRDLCQTIIGFKNLPIAGYKVIKEKRATFIPDEESKSGRLPNATHLDNFFIAGDWTDTGYPATIESAITSARKCADLLLRKIT